MTGPIKGFPTSQIKITGIPDTIPQYASLQPQDLGLRAAVDTTTRFAFRVDSDTVPRTAQAGTGNSISNTNMATIVADTATPARVGDFVRFIDGAAANLEIPIVAVETNAFLLAARLPSANTPASGDEFYIMRYATQRVDENGSQIVTVTQGPITFVLDGNTTEVEEDTGTPADSRPLPVKILNGSGTEVDFATETKQDVQITELQDIEADLEAMSDKLPATLGQKTMAASLAVVIASDQPALPLPTGAATEAKQDDEIAELQDIEAELGNVSGLITAGNLILTDIETNTAATVTAVQAVETDIEASNVILADIEANTATAVTELQDIEADIEAMSVKLPATIGQKASAASLAVVPASDYTPPASGVPAAATTKQAAVTVGTSAVRLTTDGSAPSATRRVLRFMVDPTSVANFYYGSSSVTTTSTTRGIPVFPGAENSFPNDANDYYIISDTAAQTVFVVEVE